MSFDLRLLSKKEAPEYKALLARSFGSAQGFAVQAGTSDWTVTDDYYPVLGAFQDNQLVSVLRLEWIETQKELDYKVGEPLLVPGGRFPMGYLAKAGTVPELKNSGLNSLLRYYALKICQAWKVHLIFGLMVQGSPRVTSMEEMGYKFTLKKTKWNGAFVSDLPVLIACLDADQKLAFALEYLEGKIPDLIAQYKLHFEPSKVPMSSNLKLKFPWQTGTS